MTETSRALPVSPTTTRLAAAVRFDLDSEPQEIVQRAAMQLVLDGEEPFVWWTWLGAPCDPVELLPPGVTLVRTSASGGWKTVLAKGSGYHVLIDSRGDARVTVSATTPELAAEVGIRIQEDGPTRNVDDSVVDMRFWYESRGEMHWTTNAVDTPAWQEISVNYSPPTGASLESLMSTEPSALKGTAGRLLVWHGAPGTGKTFAIRALARAWSRWCEPQYLCDIATTFKEPDQLLQVLLKSPGRGSDGELRQWKLVIAEDVDRYLDVHAPEPLPLDRLLNATDGLLAQSSRAIVLLTMNTEPRRLNQALVRPGRCLGLTEFQRFSRAEAQRWLEGASLGPGERFSLADLFAARGDIAPTIRFDRDRLGQYL